MLELDLTSSKPSQNILKYETSNFPGGEIFFRLNTEKVLEPVTIFVRLTSSNEIMRLIMAVDSLRRVGCEEIHLNMMYCPYAQQDRVCNPGESHSLKVFANLINSLKFKTVTVFDPHSNVTEAVFDNLIVIDNSEFIRHILLYEDELREKPLNIVVPDAGAAKKIWSLVNKKVFEGVDYELVICDKMRNPKTTQIIGMTCPVLKNNNDCLIIDDLCLGGKTFTSIVDVIKNQNKDLSRKFYLAVSHGIFNYGFEVFKNYFSGIYCTDSYRDINTYLVKQYKFFR